MEQSLHIPEGIYKNRNQYGMQVLQIPRKSENV